MILAIAIGTAGALLGFYLGVRSKAVAKKKAIDKEKKQVESLKTIVNRKAPPPPQKVETNYKHKKPGLLSTYSPNTFAKTSICLSCNTIAYFADMWSNDPCPYCGGRVKSYKACKWNGKKWIESTVS